MRLYSYFNSSTSFRVRIALALKRVSYESVPVNLRSNSQQDPEYVQLNPSAGVPVLIDGEFVLTQSLAIAEYLDTRFPDPPLLPEGARARARVLELSYAIGCDIHPVNNMRVLKYLKQVFNAADEQTQAWYRHWVSEGIGAVEQLLARQGSEGFCYGESPTLADCCLVPQVFNALRMGCQLEEFQRVMGIYRHCMGLPAFQEAVPSNQIDYVG